MKQRAVKLNTTDDQEFTIDDLKPDPNNLNRGTPRGQHVIEHSISTHGAGRSGLAANDGTMIAGNQTLQKMQELGFTIKPVHTTGNEWVVVIRDDIEPGSEAAALLGLEDNRASQVGLNLNPVLLADLAARYTESVGKLYFPQELALELSKAGSELVTLGDIGTARAEEKPAKYIECPNCKEKVKI